jgi:hypothetical protein
MLGAASISGVPPFGLIPGASVKIQIFMPTGAEEEFLAIGLLFWLTVVVHKLRNVLVEVLHQHDVRVQEIILGVEKRAAVGTQGRTERRSAR